MENFNITEVHQKVQFLGREEGSQKTIYRENCLKREGLESLQIYGWAKRDRWCFWARRVGVGRWYPMHTIASHETVFWIFFIFICQKFVEKFLRKHFLCISSELLLCMGILLKFQLRDSLFFFSKHTFPEQLVRHKYQQLHVNRIFREKWKSRNWENLRVNQYSKHWKRQDLDNWEKPTEGKENLIYALN